MFACSSKRASSSTTTVTSLPPRAASISARMSSEFVPVRYTVCLMATTVGSTAACRIKLITGLNDSYGWCNKMSALRIALNTSGSMLNAGGNPGTNGLNLRSGRSTNSGICIKRTRFTGPLTRYRSSGARLNCCKRNSETSVEHRSATSRRTASPKLRCGNSPCKAVRKLVISSSSTYRSELRVTRN